MRVMVWLPLVVSALLGAGAPIISRRLAPKTAALTLTFAAVVAATCWVVSLALLSATVIGQIELVAGMGRWSPAALRQHNPVAATVGLIAAGVLAVLTVAVLVVAWRRVRALVAAERVIRSHATYSLLVLADATPDAYAIGGFTGGRVAVSTGMLSALDDGERRALLAHEHAHVTGRHHLLRAVVGLAAAVNPMLFTLPGVLEIATERWADEEAAVVVGDRRIVAKALSRAALATLGQRAPKGVSSQTALHASFNSAFHRQAVPSRVSALLRPPAVMTRRPLIVVALLLAAAVVATVGASRDLHALFETARLVRGTGG